MKPISWQLAVFLQVTGILLEGPGVSCGSPALFPISVFRSNVAACKAGLCFSGIWMKTNLYLSSALGLGFPFQVWGFPFHDLASRLPVGVSFQGLGFPVYSPEEALWRAPGALLMCRVASTRGLYQGSPTIWCERGPGLSDKSAS